MKACASPGEKWYHCQLNYETTAHLYMQSCFFSLQQNVQDTGSHKLFLKGVTMLDKIIKIMILYNFAKKKKILKQDNISALPARQKSCGNLL